MISPDVILLLDGDQNAIYQLEKAFRRCSISNPVHVVRYCDEAILYLNGIGVYGNRKNFPRPCIVLIDVVHPRGDGIQLLKWIRQQPQLQDLPAIVLVDRQDDPRIQESFDYGACAYLLKTAGSQAISQMLGSIKVVNEVFRKGTTSDQNPRIEGKIIKYRRRSAD